MTKRVKSSKMKPNGLLVKKKRPRLQLSDLPMDVLHSIVSLLPIREAVRTSILSKHWKHVWCSRTNLEFSFKSLVYKKGSRIPCSLISDVFIQRVDAVLEHHSGVVDKMEVETSMLHNEHTEHIDRWVKFAIASKIKQLVFDFVVQLPEKELYRFPFHFFDATTGSHLQSLKLGSICLNQPTNIKFLLDLRKLELIDVNVTDDELKVLLFNCKVLEFLGISCCRMVTSLHTHHGLNQLKHLHVSKCPVLRLVELNSGLTTLEYEGSLIPLAPPRTLRNISMKSSDIRSALAYIFTGLPSTLPRLEMLTLRCRELKRATLPNKPFEFHYLRHLRLELDFVSLRRRRTDALDLACLLEAAPFMETLEIHMWKDYQLKRYHKYDGDLRSLSSLDHSHLKLVSITGFYGQKDQLELALHILRISTVLEAMKIDPRPMVAATTLSLGLEDGICFVEGYKVARKYLRKVDNRGVVHIVKVRRKDVENVWPYKLIDPDWLALASEEE